MDGRDDSVDFVREVRTKFLQFRDLFVERIEFSFELSFHDDILLALADREELSGAYGCYLLSFFLSRSFEVVSTLPIVVLLVVKDDRCSLFTLSVAPTRPLTAHRSEGGENC